MGDVRQDSGGLKDANGDLKLDRGRPRSLPFGGRYYHFPESLQLLSPVCFDPTGNWTRVSNHVANITPTPSSRPSTPAHGDDSEPDFGSSYNTSTEVNLKPKLYGAQGLNEVAPLPPDSGSHAIRRERTQSQRQRNNLSEPYRKWEPTSLRVPEDAHNPSPAAKVNGSDFAGTSRGGDLALSSQTRLHHDGSYGKQLQCDVLGCTYPGTFRGRYERERHMKSQHGREPAVGNKNLFRCLAEGCPSLGIFWERLDKFRQHCRKAHPDLVITEHILASTVSRLQGRREGVDIIEACVTLPTSDVRPKFGVDSPHSDLGNEAPHVETPDGLAGSFNMQCSLVSLESVRQSENGKLRQRCQSGPLTISARPTLLNRIPQLVRRKRVTDVIAGADEAFSAKVDEYSRSATAEPSPAANDENNCLLPYTPWGVEVLDQKGTNQTDGLVVDSNDGSGTTGGGHFQGLNFSSAYQQPSGPTRQNTEFGAPGDGDRAGQEPRRNKKRRRSVAASRGRYPCVFHSFNERVPDPTASCQVLQEYISGLEKHHERSAHSLFYCTVCFVRFGGVDERKLHVGEACPGWKCVTPGCQHEGMIFRDGLPCPHRNNTQRDQWRALFKLARPGIPVPDPETAVSHTPQRRPSTSSMMQERTSLSPYDPMLAPVGSLDGHLQSIDPLLSNLNVPNQFSTDGIPRARTAEAEGVAQPLQEQPNDFDPGPSAIARNAYIACMTTLQQLRDDMPNSNAWHLGRLRHIENNLQHLWLETSHSTTQSITRPQAPRTIYRETLPQPPANTYLSRGTASVQPPVFNNDSDSQAQVADVPGSGRVFEGTGTAIPWALPGIVPEAPYSTVRDNSILQSGGVDSFQGDLGLDGFFHNANPDTTSHFTDYDNSNDVGAMRPAVTSTFANAIFGHSDYVGAQETERTRSERNMQPLAPVYFNTSEDSAAAPRHGEQITDKSTPEDDSAYDSYMYGQFFDSGVSEKEHS